jgi:Uma2 family endonuclease
MEQNVSANPKARITPEEYLALERKAETRSEYFDGELYPMPGTTLEHTKIVVNIATDLNTQFRDRPCEVYTQDLRVRVSPTGYCYPDLAALCGEPRLEDEHNDTLLNPQLIIEVLSESTESYDRGRKFAQYRKIESLREYVLVSQTECRIERFLLQDDGNWLYSELTDPTASLELPSVACRLHVSDVYHKMDF